MGETVVIYAERPTKETKSSHMSQYNVGATSERVAMDILGPLPESESGTNTCF